MFHIVHFLGCVSFVIIYLLMRFIVQILKRLFSFFLKLLVVPCSQFPTTSRRDKIDRKSDVNRQPSNISLSLG